MLATFIFNNGNLENARREEVDLALPPEVGKVYYDGDNVLTVTGIKEEIRRKDISKSVCAKVIVYVNEHKISYLKPEG